MRSFVADQGTKWPKAAAKNPDEDWIHLRTTNRSSLPWLVTHHHGFHTGG
ncbi:hypothetical protein OHA61_00915 [Streptomyces sp. NBC_00885]|nr:hypothetical protein OHA61_00915 [Streptomyces sp. NBC_00885]